MRRYGVFRLWKALQIAVSSTRTQDEARTTMTRQESPRASRLAIGLAIGLIFSLVAWAVAAAGLIELL